MNLGPEDIAVLRHVAHRQRSLLDATPTSITRALSSAGIHAWRSGDVWNERARSLAMFGYLNATMDSVGMATRRYTLTTAGWEVVGDMPIHLQETVG